MFSSCPWDQLPGENGYWYSCFTEWLYSAKPRSFLAIYNARKARKGAKPTKTLPNSWNEAKDKFRWQERGNAFDAAEAERVKKEYAERIELQRQRELRASDLLYAKAEALVELPHLREKMEMEGVEVVLIPDHFAFKTARELFAESKAQARGALDMTEKKQSLELDLSKLPADALSGLLVAAFSEEDDAREDPGGDATAETPPSESD